MHSYEEVVEFERISNKYNLIVSGGSDFHGDNLDELGMYLEDKQIPVNILDKIKRHRLYNFIQ